jgi:hypothetical protein
MIAMLVLLAQVAAPPPLCWTIEAGKKVDVPCMTSVLTVPEVLPRQQWTVPKKGADTLTITYAVPNLMTVLTINRPVDDPEHVTVRMRLCNECHHEGAEWICDCRWPEVKP